MSDYNLQVKVRNAHILRRIREQYASVAEMSRKTGLSGSTIGKFLNMTGDVFLQSGDLSKPALDLCTALNATPSELWPKQMAKAKVSRASHEIEISEAEAMAVAGDPEAQTIQRSLLEKWCQILRPREVESIALMEAGHTYAEAGQELGGVSAPRARQIHLRALGKLRKEAAKDGVRSLLDAS